MSRVALLVAVVAVTAGTAEARGSEGSAVDVAQLDRAQRAVTLLKAKLGLPGVVTAELVERHPLIVAVEPLRDRRGCFHLKLEAAFVSTLSDEELNAVIAHELGHVWIFSHHPYLQTEQLANQIAMRVVSRQALEGVYRKVEAHGGKKADVLRFAGLRAGR